MSLVFIVSITLITLLTAIISGAIGMGGGVLLLSFMTFVMPVSAIVPIHGLIQMQNNSYRFWLLRSFIKKDFCGYFILGAIFGVVVSAYILKTFAATNLPLILILSLILYSVFKPKRMPALILSAKQFSIIGLIAGFLGIFVGATGPFMANFFIRNDFSNQEIVANKSAMQAFIHITKLPIFLYLGFDYSLYWMPLIGMSLAGFIGTKFGVSLIQKIDKQLFVKLYKSALLLAAVRICYKLINF